MPSYIKHFKGLKWMVVNERTAEKEKMLVEYGFMGLLPNVAFFSQTFLCDHFERDQGQKETQDKDK